MKRIIIANLIVFSFYISAMDHQQHAVVRLPYAQQRKIDGTRQLIFGAPLLVAGSALAIYSAPIAEAGHSDYYSFAKFISGFLSIALGVERLAHSCDNLVCNDDECQDNCEKACKAIWQCEGEEKQD